jgi:hypothetical protein
MLDFWELSGRLLLMDPTQRQQKIYTNLLPIQGDGCILLGHAQTALLPFPIPGFYNAVRTFFAQTYTGANAIYSPVISMFALGEIGTMFFNQPFRDLFEAVSLYLKTQSNIQGRTDNGSTSFFYMVLMLLVIDRTTRDSVGKGNFLGLDQLPPAPSDKPALTLLANDAKLGTLANNMCLGVPGAAAEAPWTRGSMSVLRDQDYGPQPPPAAAGTPVPAATAPIPFSHVRFVPGIKP